MSSGAPTPAGTSVFTKHNWDMRMGYLRLNGWSIYGLLGWAFDLIDGAFISLNVWGVYDLMVGAYVTKWMEHYGLMGGALLA